MRNALTIDVEDYYMVSAFSDIVKFEDWPRFESRVERNTERILDLLDEHGVKATFFVLGWVAEHYPRLVRDIHKRGHYIASHGYNHRIAYELDRTTFREDTRRSKRIIEDVTGQAVSGYRAASYSITKDSLWTLAVLMEEGFTYDSSIFPIFHDRYGYPDFSRFPEMISNGGPARILEIPLSTVRIFGKNIPIAGGGYLRFFPVRFIEWGIRSINVKESKPAIIYFHPWEVDEKLPRLKGSMLSSFRHHVNVNKTFLKVKRLLETFKFSPIEEVFAKDLNA